MFALFQVKSLYDTYVQKIPKFANETPTYPSWFEPHVMRWFQEYEENSLTFVENAVKADKQEGVSQTPFDTCMATEFFSLPNMGTNLSPSQRSMCSAIYSKATSWSRDSIAPICSSVLVTCTVMQKLCTL